MIVPESGQAYKALIRPVHRGPTLNDILLTLADIMCLILIDETQATII